MCLKSIYTHVAHTLLYGEYFVWCTPSPVQQKQTKLFVCTARNVHSLLLLFQSDKRYKMYYYCTVLFKKKCIYQSSLRRWFFSSDADRTPSSSETPSDQTSRNPHFLHSDPDDFSIWIRFGGRSASGFRFASSGATHKCIR